MTKRTNKRQGSVVDMVRRMLPEDKEFSDELSSQINRRQLASRLAILRNQRGISQADVAEQLNCTQSRISKLENGYDEEITIGDLAAYAKLADCDLTIVFSPGHNRLADKVKYHAACIAECFEQMNDLIKDDKVIGNGVTDFIRSTFFSFMTMFDKAISRLRLSERRSREPRISLQVQDSPLDCSSCGEPPPRILSADFSSSTNPELAEV